MSNYTQSQIKAAKDNAKLHGYTQDFSDDVAIEYLNWFHANKSKCKSMGEAIGLGLSGESPTGIRRQEAWWESRSKRDRIQQN